MARLNRRRFLQTAGGLFVPAAFGIVKADVILPGPIMRTIANSLMTNLVGYWKLDESSDGSGPVTREDSTTNNLDLTDTSPYAASVAGKISNGCQFVSASNEYLSKSDTSLLRGGDTDFTIAVWANLDSDGATQEWIVSKYLSAGDKREYGLYYDDATDTFIFRKSSDGTAAALTDVSWSATVTTGTWYFIVCGHDSVNDRTFISVNNGTMVYSSTTTTGVYGGTASFIVGQNANAGIATAFNGKIDEVGFWRKVLSSTEITYLYNTATGRTYPFFT